MERDHQTLLPVVLITWCLSVGSINRALAESQLIGSPQPIIAVAGDDVILPCSLVPPIDVKSMAVEWSRPGMKPEYVHVYRNRRILVRDQHPSYRNRTSLFEGELINGNVSLKLSRVQLEDQGNYTCFIPTYSKYKHAVIQLIVVAVSDPKITKMQTNNTGRVLQCESKSWYPEPQLEWREGLKDSEGRLLSADVTQTHRESDGCYTVRGSVTVQKTDTNMFTCRVQIMKFNLKREAEIHVPGSSFQLTEPSSVSNLSVGARVMVVLGVVGVVGVVIVVIVGVRLYRHRQNKSKQPAGSNVTEVEMRSLRQRSPPPVTLRQRSPPRDPDIPGTNGGSRFVPHTLQLQSRQKGQRLVI